MSSPDPRYPYQILDPILEAEGISQSFGGKLILENLSVTIHDVVRPDITQGQVVAILGPSGIGKTTLLRILAGLDRPTNGMVHLHTPSATPSRALVRAGDVGVVYQHSPLFEHRRVLGNLLCVSGSNRQLHDQDARTHAMGLLESFGIAGTAKQFPGQLSGGQRRRLAVAQQLMTGNTIILMDEPFVGLDPLAKVQVGELIKETADLDEHGTIVVITHDVRAALRVADTVWLMGRQDDDGAPTLGARIVEHINLMDSIAWRPDNHRLPLYQKWVEHIESRYPALKGDTSI